MRRSGRFLARAGVSVLMISVAASPAVGAVQTLFDAISTPPYFNYEANVGIALPGATPSAITHSLSYLATGGAETVSVGLVPDSAEVTEYVPAAGDAGEVGSFYDPPQEDLVTDLRLVGAHLIDGQPATIADGGKVYIVADLEQVVGTHVHIGEADGDFYLHGELVSPGGQLPAMRLWGEQGAGVGRMQLVIELDADGRVPEEPASEHGKVVPAGTLVYWDGAVTLGSYLDAESQEQWWTFSESLYDGDFGAFTSGQIQVASEPGTWALLVLGSAVWIARRRG